MKVISNTIRILRNVAGILVVGIFTWMVFLATAQLILRWLKIDALSWSDIQLRHLLLWYALAGGILATSEDRQIHIDLVAHYFPANIKGYIGRIISLFSSTLCYYLTYISIQFILSERGGGSEISGLLFGASAPIWWIEVAIPISFALMGTLFLLRTMVTPDASKPVLRPL